MSNSDLFGSPMILPGIRPASPFGAAIRPSFAERVYRGVSEITQRAFGPVIRRMRIRRTVLELSNLDAHMLRDIGLDRSSIISTAHEVEERLHGRGSDLRA